jgi:hypothetical protein
MQQLAGAADMASCKSRDQKRGGEPAKQQQTKRVKQRLETKQHQNDAARGDNVGTGDCKGAQYLSGGGVA